MTSNEVVAAPFVSDAPSACGPASDPAAGPPAADPQPVVVKGLRKSFGEQQVLKGIDLSVSKGEILAVLGKFDFRKWPSQTAEIAAAVLA